MRKRLLAVLIACVTVLFPAAGVLAQNPILNPSFEQISQGAPLYWNRYEYTAPPMGSPGLPSVGCVGVGCQFQVLYPPNIPNGANVCGIEAWGYTKNGGVRQSFFWNGAASSISVSTWALSQQYSGGLWDNGCRVRIGLVPYITNNRTDVTTWVTGTWGNAWSICKVYVTNTGNYTLFIENYQPQADAIMSTLWDNVVWTVLPPINCTSGPTPAFGNSSYPDTTKKIEWTTDVASTSRVEYSIDDSYSLFVEDSQLVTNHSVMLTGLSHTTEYNYRVKSTRQDYRDYVSPNLKFTTPIWFYNIAATFDGSALVVTWNTDKPSTSQVEYGETTSYGTLTTEDSTLTTIHAVHLPVLPEEKEYHFRVWGRNDPLYTPAHSSDRTFRTMPSPKASLENGGFESTSLYPWAQYTRPIPEMEEIRYYPIDGVIGPYPKGGPNFWPDYEYPGVQAYDGQYFLGAAAHNSFKYGGALQRVYATPGNVYTLAARYTTLQIGGSWSYTRIEIGIDPNGGLDPYSTNVQKCTVYSWPNNGQWQIASVTTQAESSVITAFLNIIQEWPILWHVAAIDHVELGEPVSMTIGQLRQSSNGLSAVITNKVVTYVDPNGVSFNGKGYRKAYIEEEDRSAGIGVLFDLNKPNLPVRGNKVTVTGSLVLADMEAVLLAHSWTRDSATYNMPVPIGLCQRDMGGEAPTQPRLYGTGWLCNIGLRVRVFGKITWVSTYNPYEDAIAYIDDGSNLLDHEPFIGEESTYGIQVSLPGKEYGVVEGDYIAVTGVLTTDFIDIDELPMTDDEYCVYWVAATNPGDWMLISQSPPP